MAKRLNKKVALIGLAVLLVLGVVFILVVSTYKGPHWFVSSEKLIKDGDTAVKAAEEATDDQIKLKKYEEAERSYLRARARAKTNPDRIDILFKLVDMYVETDQWPKALGCWKEIISIDPKNFKARFGQLKYFYTLADTGARLMGDSGTGVWQEVQLQASEFIEVADASLLAQDITERESFGIKETTGIERLGAYLYLLRGRATFELARMRTGVDPVEAIAKAIDDLEKVQELEPKNVDVYWYLAQAIITRGESLALRGNFEERDKAADEAVEYLDNALKVVGDDVRAHVNLLVMKLFLVRTSSAERPREQIQALEPQYLSLVDRFKSSAPAYSALAGFYHLLGPKNLDKAIEAAEKAVELDKDNIGYAITAATLHYNKFSIYGQKPHLYKAIEVAKNALTLPDAQDKPGPRYLANRVSRISLYTFLANCYVEQVLEPCEPRTDSQKQQWLTNAQEAVHQIEQLYGSGEHPEVIKWRGMLELAKENRDLAIRELYKTYEQLKASGRRDVQIPYILAKLFENTSELGAVVEFFSDALGILDRKTLAGIDRTKPEAFLDYADVLLKLEQFEPVLNIVNFFEEQYWPNQRTRALRVKALIGTNQLDEAEKQLANTEYWPADDPNTIKLKLVMMETKIGQLRRNIAQRQMGEELGIISQITPDVEKQDIDLQAADRLMAAELNNCLHTSAQLLQKLLLIEPNSVPMVPLINVCNNYIQQGQVQQARNLVNQFLTHFPDSPTILFYKGILAEPEPDKISPERRKQIEEQALSDITDPVRRAMNLGIFYQRNDELDKAAEQFKKVLGAKTSPDGIIEVPTFDKSRQISEPQRLATDYLFDVAIEAKDWQLAEQIVTVARRRNVDGCSGVFFAARLDIVKAEYDNALAKLNECLKQRPVFSYCYFLRGKVDAALGNERASIEDVRKAASLNPLDGAIAKELAFMLYRRNARLANNVSPSQLIEVKDALIRAIRLNPMEWQLQSFYAEYISKENPGEALAIRQRLQKAVPNTENALMLGSMAMKMALQETDAERKKMLFDIAASTFQQALNDDPQSKELVDGLAEYYRLTGQGEKAKQLLAQSQDDVLLYAHYMRIGRFDEARKIAEQLYTADPKNISAVKALLLVAQRTDDREAVKKYSEELLLLDDDIEHYLVQIQVFLNVGLVEEAEHKLQSLKEKFPDEPRALLLEASLVMKRGQLEKALELTNQSLQSDQNNAVAWRLRGEINFLMADYEQAVNDIKKGMSLSEQVTAPIALAEAYLKTGRREDAITELKNVISGVEEISTRSALGSAPQNKQKARLLLEHIYLRLGRRKQLSQFYDETLKALPDSVFWYNRAGAFAILQQEFSRAEQLYGQAWRNGQKTGTADATAFSGYLKALILNAGQNPEKLGKVFEQASKYIDSDFAPIAYLRMAEVKYKLGDKITTMQYYQEALKKAGTNRVLTISILREMYLMLGPDTTPEVCKELLKTNPDSLVANYTMFNLAAMNGQYNEAIGYIDKCLQIIGSDSLQRIDFRVQKAMLLQSAYAKTSDNNYLKIAIIEYESLLTEMPNNTVVLNNLAYMLAESNERLTEALQYTKRACELSPNNPDFMDTYSYVLYKNGQPEDAAESLHAALQRYEQNEITAPVEVYEHLGMVKEQLGQKTQALAAYRQALEQGADKLSDKVKKRIENAIKRLSD